MFGRHYFGPHYFGPHYFGGGGSTDADPAYLIASVRIYAALSDIEMEIGAALACHSTVVDPALGDVEINASSELEGGVETQPALLGSPKANRRLN